MTKQSHSGEELRAMLDLCERRLKTSEELRTGLAKALNEARASLTSGWREDVVKQTLLAAHAACTCDACAYAIEGLSFDPVHSATAPPTTAQEGKERFEIYGPTNMDIGDASGHVCTAENPEWAERICRALNHGVACSGGDRISDAVRNSGSSSDDTVSSAGVEPPPVSANVGELVARFVETLPFEIGGPNSKSIANVIRQEFGHDRLANLIEEIADPQRDWGGGGARQKGENENTG